MKKFQKYFVLAPLLIIFNCAGVVNSRNQEVTISTSPTDAYVKVTKNSLKQ